MKAMLRALALPGLLMALATPASADEIVKTHSYVINGVELPTQHVAVEETRTAVLKDGTVERSPAPVVEQKTSVVRDGGDLTETRTTIARESPETVTKVIAWPFNLDSEFEVTREFAAVVETERLPDFGPQHQTIYFPLLDYSVFDKSRP